MMLNGSSLTSVLGRRTNVSKLFSFLFLRFFFQVMKILLFLCSLQLGSCTRRKRQNRDWPSFHFFKSHSTVPSVGPSVCNSDGPSVCRSSSLSFCHTFLFFMFSETLASLLPPKCSCDFNSHNSHISSLVEVFSRKTVQLESRNAAIHDVDRLVRCTME